MPIPFSSSLIPFFTSTFTSLPLPPLSLSLSNAHGVEDDGNPVMYRSGSALHITVARRSDGKRLGEKHTLLYQLCTYKAAGLCMSMGLRVEVSSRLLSSPSLLWRLSLTLFSQQGRFAHTFLLLNLCENTHEVKLANRTPK